MLTEKRVPLEVLTKELAERGFPTVVVTKLALLP